jgi:hypothetical protein
MLRLTEPTTGSATQKQPTKDERDIDTMTLCLRMPPLNNKATYTEWYEQVRDFTSKKDVVDGKVKEAGWSEKTFNRKLELVKEKFGDRLVKFGVGQGATYTLLKDAKAKEGVQPEARTTANQETVSPKAQSRHPPLGDDSDDSAFGGQSSTVNHCHDGGDSGSRESRTGENPVVETDLEKAARDHLNATKH